MQKLSRFGQSLSNYIWNLLEPDERIVEKLVQDLGITHILATILVNRGIDSIEKARSFLTPKIRDILPNPYEMKNMAQGVKRFIKAIENKEKITIFGDYDVDGATSSSIIYMFLKAINIDSDIYIPNRLSEGYGPNIQAFEKIHQNNSSLLITVDCGTSAYEPLKWADKIGLDLIVIDHHLPSAESLPPATAIINPKNIDDDFPYKNIAAVGVTFFFLIAVRGALRENNWFVNNGITEPDLMQFLDLVALGTVCDVMPLTMINRVFVKQGIKFMEKRSNLGLSALNDMLNIGDNIHSYHLGYIIGPRINAGGRVNESSLGAQLLVSNDYEEACEIAKKLEQLNEERKAIESLAMKEAISYIEDNTMKKNAIIMAFGNEWHIGVLGILASRLKEKYHKPTIVITQISDELCKGSARSIAGFDMGRAILIAKEREILIEGGGHAMAGGFSLSQNKIKEFYNFLLAEFQKTKNKDVVLTRARELKIDSLISIGAINKEFFDSIDQAAPFGQGNEQPKFVIMNAKIIKSYLLRGIHVACLIQDDMSNKSLRCISFKGMTNEVGKAIISAQNKKFNFVGTIHHSNVDRERYEFIIDDIAVSVN